MVNDILQEYLDYFVVVYLDDIIIYPILMYPNLFELFQVVTNASDIAIGSILSQLDDTNIFHPVAYYSRKFISPQLDFLECDKFELVVLVTAFKDL